jgi:hypothetical protein
VVMRVSITRACVHFIFFAPRGACLSGAKVEF